MPVNTRERSSDPAPSRLLPRWARAQTSSRSQSQSQSQSQSSQTPHNTSNNDNEDDSDFSFEEGTAPVPMDVPPQATTRTTTYTDREPAPSAAVDPVVRWVDQQPRRRTQPRIAYAPATLDTNRDRFYDFSYNYSPQRLPTIYMNNNSNITPPLQDVASASAPAPAPAPAHNSTTTTRPPRLWISDLGAPHYPHSDPHSDTHTNPHQLPRHPRTFQRYDPSPISMDLSRSSTDADLLRALNIRSAVDLSAHQYYSTATQAHPGAPTSNLRQNQANQANRNPLPSSSSPSSSQYMGPNLAEEPYNIRRSMFSHNTSHFSTRIPSYSQSLNSQMTSFLSERRAAGVAYDEHSQHKSSNKRKRTFREVIGQQEKDPYEIYKFEKIRPRSSILMRPGMSFDFEEIMKLNIVDVVEDETKEKPIINSLNGFMEFDDPESLKYWLKTYTNKRSSSKYMLSDDKSTLNFTTKVVDFEDNDLRFHTAAPERDYTTSSISYLQFMQTMGSKEPHGLNSCLIWSQINLWQSLPPLQELSSQEAQSILVCADCLASLQERFILFKLCFEGSPNDDYPDMIGTLNRSNGEMSLVATHHDANGPGASAMQMIDMRRGYRGRGTTTTGTSTSTSSTTASRSAQTTLSPVVKLTACSKRHSLDSVALS